MIVAVCPAIVSVPDRAAPVPFAAALNVTEPLPLPDAGLVIEIQAGAPFATLHAQLGSDAVTVTDPLPPAAGTACVAGATAYVHAGGGGGGADWFTVNVCPAIVAVPDRAGPALAATFIETDPLPVPDVALLNVIHGTFGAAVHAHVGADAVMVTVAGPPVLGTAWLAGAIVNVHGGGAAP